MQLKIPLLELFQANFAVPISIKEINQQSKLIWSADLWQAGKSDGQINGLTRPHL